MPIFDEFQFLFLDLQFAVLPADNDGLLLGAAHHDALDEGLAAAHGLKALGTGVLRAGIDKVGFFFHFVAPLGSGDILSNQLRNSKRNIELMFDI